MTFQVLLTDDASRDLEELYDYIESHDAPGRAEYVLEQLEKAFSSLSENPAGEPGRRNSWQSGCASTARFFSSPTASFTGSWLKKSMCW